MHARTFLLSIPVLLTACVAAPPMVATTTTASAGPAPGQWQLVIEVDDLPGAGKVAPRTMSLCSTPEDKRQWQDMVGGKAAAGCSVRDYKAAGATISYAMHCVGGIEGATMITVQDENSYRGESTMTLRSGDKPAVIRSKVTATRTGATCRK